MVFFLFTNFLISDVEKYDVSTFAAGFQFDYVFDWTVLRYQQSQIAGAPSRAVVCHI